MGAVKTVILALVTGVGVLALVWWRVRMNAVKVWHGLPRHSLHPTLMANPCPLSTATSAT